MGRALFSPPPRLVPFPGEVEAGSRSVGRVHPDGSIAFRGRTFRTIKDLPSECRILRADLASEVQWRKLYRAVDPGRKRQR